MLLKRHHKKQKRFKNKTHCRASDCTETKIIWKLTRNIWANCTDSGQKQHGAEIGNAEIGNDMGLTWANDNVQRFVRCDPLRLHPLARPRGQKINAYPDFYGSFCTLHTKCQRPSCVPSSPIRVVRLVPISFTNRA